MLRNVNTYSMAITQAQAEYLARKAHWYFDVQFPQTGFNGDSVVYTGDGIDDLNRFRDLMASQPKAKYLVDVGTLTSSWQVLVLSDVDAMRTAYVSFYGSTSKPPLAEYDSAAFQHPFAAVQG